MLTKMRKKGKKGFTLVELIVVIAIIAILAAVAVPTTIHFVEQANISNEQSEINYKQNIDGLFTNATVPGGEFNIAGDASVDGTLAKLLSAEIKAPVSTIEFTVTDGGNGKYTVSYVIYGTEYKGKSDVKGAAPGDFTKGQIFNGNAAPAAGKYTYKVADGTMTYAA